MGGRKVLGSVYVGREGGRERKGMRADDWGWNSVLVKAWNYSTWPAYRSRLWNKEQNGSEGAKAR